MATAVVSKRNVQGFVILFISVLLLLSSIYCGLSALNHSSLEKGVTHLQLSYEKSAAFNLPNDLVKSFAAELAARDIAVNYSSSYAHSTDRGGQAKRARPVDFESEFQAAKDQGVDTAFQRLLGRANVPTEQQSLYTVLYQDKTFTNAERGVGPIAAFRDQAYYKQYYFPSISAILASDINSPANQTIWKQLAKDDYKKLRYIAHDNTANLQTEHVMENIFTKHSRKDASSGSESGSGSGSESASGTSSGTSPGTSSGSSSSDGEDEPEFPGLSFGMDSDEGKALLGIPNGIGTARILVDRATELGRRELKVYIFAREDGKYCMLWDMHPPGRPSMPDQHKGKKRRVRGNHPFSAPAMTGKKGVRGRGEGGPVMPNDGYDFYHT
ncbi:MAG: hypothetical protein Q9207_006608 [Kuettlingeria erythrocarpa]